MERVYWVCLIIGAMFSVVSMIFGDFFGDIDFDFEIELSFLPVKPFMVMLLLTGYGGSGLILMKYLPMLLCNMISASIGLVLAFVVYKFIYVKVNGYESLAPTSDDALFVCGTVVNEIPPEGFGKIMFVVRGNTITATAKEYKTSHGIEQDTKVRIMDIEDSIFYVCDDLQAIAALTRN